MSSSKSNFLQTDTSTAPVSAVTTYSISVWVKIAQILPQTHGHDGFMSQFLLAERYCSTGHHDHLSPLGLQFCNLHEHCFSCNIKVAFHHEQYGILYASHYRKLLCQHKDKKHIKQANKQPEIIHHNTVSVTIFICFSVLT